MGIFKQGPATAVDHTRMGYQHWKEGRPDDAVREYREALAVDPDFALARSNLGFVYKQLGKTDAAIREWEETLRRGAGDGAVGKNTEDWLEEARALRDQRSKPIADDDASVRSQIAILGQANKQWVIALDALQRIGAPAVPALVEAIESDNALLRSRALSLLGTIADPRAVAPLEKAASISEADFRSIAKVSGPTRIVDVGGTRIEIPLSDDLADYRDAAKAALAAIRKGA
jgi:tetratricopeptide (TPR) repeat protein